MNLAARISVSDARTAASTIWLISYRSWLCLLHCAAWINAITCFINSFFDGINEKFIFWLPTNGLFSFGGRVDEPWYMQWGNFQRKKKWLQLWATSPLCTKKICTHDRIWTRDLHFLPLWPTELHRHWLGQFLSSERPPKSRRLHWATRQCSMFSDNCPFIYLNAKGEKRFQLFCIFPWGRVQAALSCMILINPISA